MTSKGPFPLKLFYDTMNGLTSPESQFQ